MKYRLIILLMQFLSYLPLGFCRTLGKFAGLLAWHTGSRMRKTTLTNLALCFPDMPQQQRLALGKASVQQTMQTIMETGAIWLWPAERTLGLVKEVAGFEVLQAARDRGKGVIVMGPHLGNWELLGLYLTTCGMGPVLQLYQAPTDPRIDDFILRARGRSGATLVPTDNKGVGELLKALRSGAVVGILPDQVPPRSGGEYAPFFGVPALTMTLLVKLQQKTGAQIVASFAERIPQGFRIHFVAADPAIHDSNPAVAVAAMNRSVENLVRLAPEQYQWEYKRFRHLPPDMAPVYKR
jgi:Kdo2-lipid IVA lauroyltransferase/acyltransferase